MRMSLVMVSFFISTWISGCTSLNTLTGSIEYQEDFLKETTYQVEIATHDGLQLSATVFQPNLAKDAKAPLIIHAHGFGAFRVSSEYSLYAQVALSAEMVLDAWKAGYWVISYDHRGFGDSDGEISLMDPDKEVKDVSTIIDWAIVNLPNLKSDATDISLGMIGESYGGGAQLLASVFDERIDAIVPITTWYDFNDAFELGSVKTIWAGILYYGGELASGFDIDETATELFNSGLLNELEPRHINYLSARNFAFYCAGKQFPHADAFLIQAFNDTALNASHGFKSRHCFQAANKDVRLLMIQDGHNAPIVDGLSRMPFYSNDDYVNCGADKFKTTDLVMNWFDNKLRGFSEDKVPGFCVTFNSDSGMTLNGYEPEWEHFNVSENEFEVGLAGLTEWLFWPYEVIKDFVWESESSTDVEGGYLRPLFVPFKVADKTEYVVGSPKVNVALNAPQEEPFAYLGVGIKKQGETSIELVDYQVKAVSNRNASVELPAISVALSPGDTLGLLVYGYHSHYMFRGPFFPQTASIQGRVSLPFISSN